ncbi:MAG: hypothetical protein ACYCZ6_08575 [Polaromonas sp.]
MASLNGVQRCWPGIEINYIPSAMQGSISWQRPHSIVNWNTGRPLAHPHTAGIDDRIVAHFDTPPQASPSRLSPA